MVSSISFGWFAYFENIPLPLLNGHPNRFKLKNFKHPGLVSFPTTSFLVNSTGVTMITVVMHLMAALATVS